jgi:hypothetical protein
MMRNAAAHGLQCRAGAFQRWPRRRPTMIDSVPWMAPSVPPLTGQSRKAGAMRVEQRGGFARRGGRHRGAIHHDRAGRQRRRERVRHDREQVGVGGHAGDDDVAVRREFGRGSPPPALRSPSASAQRFPRRPVPGAREQARAMQVAGHRQAHGTQGRRIRRAGMLSLPGRCSRTGRHSVRAGNSSGPPRPARPPAILRAYAARSSSGAKCT